MTPEDQIRMLMEENARLKAQVDDVAQGRAMYGAFGGEGVPRNQYGVTMDEHKRRSDLKAWQDFKADRGDGTMDLLLRRPNPLDELEMSGALPPYKPNARDELMRELNKRRPHGAAQSGLSTDPSLAPYARENPSPYLRKENGR